MDGPLVSMRLSVP